MGDCSAKSSDPAHRLLMANGATPSLCGWLSRSDSLPMDHRAVTVTCGLTTSHVRFAHVCGRCHGDATTHGRLTPSVSTTSAPEITPFVQFLYNITNWAEKKLDTNCTVVQEPWCDSLKLRGVDQQDSIMQQLIASLL